MKTNSRWRSVRPVGVAAAVLLLLPGCDFGLENVNIDSTRLRAVEPQFQLNDVILGSAPSNSEWRCEASIVQQHLRIFTGVAACGNFNVAQRGNQAFHWNGGYGRLMELRDVLDATREDPARQNAYNIARIMKAHTIMKITDTYGDVPYSEASQALEGIVFPAYDSQEAIYTGPEGILEELKNATAALNPNESAPNELLYGGDVVKWQRFGNSLLLRAAMRLTKVAPNVAQQYVQAAVNNPGGLMQSNADNAILHHTNDYRNSIGTTMNSNEGYNEYLPNTLVDFLRATDDPRLGAIAARWPNANAGADQGREERVLDPDAQVGIRMGYDNNTIGEVVEDLGLPSVYAFSKIDNFRMHDVLAPNFLITYSQTLLLLAEAVHRGWVQGDVSQLYADAIRADMERISNSYQDTEITPAEINAYLAANPLDLSGNVYEQINNQYWVASLVMPAENWANFRRSGYPAMPPNPLGDLTTEDFIRRFLYPESEISLNPNYDSGTMPDIMDTRIWWDVDLAGNGVVGPNG